MVLIQTASFRKPNCKNWKDKFVQLDFLVSIKELEKLVTSLKLESKGSAFVNENTQWSCLAFLEKCQCPQCKGAWKVFEVKQKKLVANVVS